jgi:hypothetical protein
MWRHVVWWIDTDFSGNLKMEAVGVFETLVSVYQTSESYISEDPSFNSHRRENLKSYI